MGRCSTCIHINVIKNLCFYIEKPTTSNNICLICRPTDILLKLYFFPAIMMFANNFTVDVAHLGIHALPIGCQHHSFNELRVEALNSLIQVSGFCLRIVFGDTCDSLNDDLVN